MNVKRFDLSVCGAALAFYLVNRLVLIPHVGGPAGWFLSCYANDIFAGAAIVAWLDLLLRLGRLKPVRSWWQVVLFVFLCSLVWEVGAPLVKAGAVFDPWDFVAYQVGGGAWKFSVQNAERAVGKEDMR